MSSFHVTLLHGKGRELALPCTISFSNRHILICYDDNSNSVLYAKIHVSQNTTLICNSLYFRTISDDGMLYRIRFCDHATVCHFDTRFYQINEEYVSDLNNFCERIADTMQARIISTSDPFLNAVVPLLYCEHSVEIEQEIHNICEFYVNLSPEDKNRYAPYLANLINYLNTHTLVTPEMVNSLIDLVPSVVNGNPLSDIRTSNLEFEPQQPQGTVYKAVNRLTKEEVAVKVYRSSDGHLKNVKNEIRSLYSLRDIPSIVHIRQAYRNNYSYYVVEEWLQGMTLLEYVQVNGPLKEQDALTVMRVLLETIRECHKRHIFHRDIKLEAVMFRTSENRLEDVVLLDFSHSIFAPADLAESFAGTEEYMSPEIHAQSLYSSKVDMWSLGVLFYGLVTGVFLFGLRESGNMKSLIENGLFMRDGPFSELSWNCRDLICHLLMVDPTKRYSAEEALRHPWFTSDRESTVAIRVHKDSVINVLQTMPSSKKCKRTIEQVSAEYIILRETEVHNIPGDNTLLFTVYPPLKVPVTSIHTNWEKNEMWIQVAHSVRDYDLKGKWILCQRKHNPYAMNKQCKLYQGKKNIPLSVFPKPHLCSAILVYPKNQYVIINQTKSDSESVYGEINTQCLLAFSSQQERELIQKNPKAYLLLSKNGSDYVDYLFPSQ